MEGIVEPVGTKGEDMASLRAEVNNLKAELARAKEGQLELRNAAEAGYRAKREFMATISHEFMTRLNAILGYSQILLRQDQLEGDQRKHLDVIRSSGEDLLTRINDLLDAVDGGDGMVGLGKNMLTVGRVFRRVMRLTRPGAEEKGIALKYEAGNEIPEYLIGDGEKLGRVLLNILTNAVKYTRSGTITLRTSYRQEAGGTLRCEVADTGVGIPPDKLGKIFEPFTQLATDRQAREGGGVGLTIAKQLITLMRGRIGVASEMQRGSVFWLEVPLPKLDFQSVHDLRRETLSDAPASAKPEEMEAAEPEEGIIAPPRVELEQLQVWALRGDMCNIQTWVAKQETERYRPFTDRLGKLADSFKTKEVLTMVKEHLNEGAHIHFFDQEAVLKGTMESNARFFTYEETLDIPLAILPLGDRAKKILEGQGVKTIRALLDVDAKAWLHSFACDRRTLGEMVALMRIFGFVVKNSEGIFTDEDIEGYRASIRCTFF